MESSWDAYIFHLMATRHAIEAKMSSLTAYDQLLPIRNKIIRVPAPVVAAPLP
jgi:hypothetical protein